MMRREIYLVLGAIPLLTIPLLGYTWLIFSVYALLIYLKDRVSDAYSRWSMPSVPKYFITFLAFGMLTEILAIVDNIPRPPSERILLNPSPAVDLYLALGFYSGFALVWSIVLRFVNMTHRFVFTVAGAFGILFEQTGRLLFTFQILAWPYVFLVYGSFQAAPALMAERENRGKNVGTATRILIGAGTELGCFVAAALLLWIFSIPIQ
jgi:hypothetical protein